MYTKIFNWPAFHSVKMQKQVLLIRIVFDMGKFVILAGTGSIWVIFLVARMVPPSFIDLGPKLRVLP